jgi:hypothetical protein
MTFDLIRIGWPNTAAVLMLATMPLVSLALPTGPPPATLSVEIIEGATQTAMLVEPQADQH